MRTPTLRFWKGLWLGAVIIVPGVSAVFLLAMPATWGGTILVGLSILFLLTLWSMMALSRRKKYLEHEGQRHEGQS